jgi:hypothetical protein
MAAITSLSQDFEGTDGATATPASLAATQTTGAGTFQYSAADPKQGSTCLQLVGGTGIAADVIYDFTAATTFWLGFYVKITALPAAAFTLASWWGNAGANQSGNLRINPDGTLAIRDLTTAKWTSVDPVPINAWFRVAVKAIPGSATGHRVKLYTSSSGNGTVADQDSGDVTATNGAATNIDRLNIGVVTNGPVTVFLDRMRADNASEPAGLTTGLPPTVNAGPDLTKEVGSSAFTITATATPSSGTTIASRSWQRLSGVTVTLAGTTTDTVTVTPPTSTTGTTVLRYTATQADGQSTTDDVTLTWVAAGQTLYPAADVSNAGGWTTQAGGTTSLFATIDEPVLDTSDYIASPQLTATAAVYRVRLQSKPAPTNTTGWYLRFNKRELPDVASISLTFKLYEADGTTLRKTWTAITTLNSADTEYQLTLTSGEVASITSWTSGLIVEVSETGT